MTRVGWMFGIGLDRG